MNPNYDLLEVDDPSDPRYGMPKIDEFDVATLQRATQFHARFVNHEQHEGGAGLPDASRDGLTELANKRGLRAPVGESSPLPWNHPFSGVNKNSTWHLVFSLDNLRSPPRKRRRPSPQRVVREPQRARRRLAVAARDVSERVPVGPRRRRRLRR